MTQDPSEKMALDVRPGASKDMIVDVGSKTISVSDLTSNETSQIDVISVARTMVETLKILGTPEDQSAAFVLAMLNSVFKNLINKKCIKKLLVDNSYILYPIQLQVPRGNKNLERKGCGSIHSFQVFRLHSGRKERSYEGSSRRCACMEYYAGLGVYKEDNKEHDDMPEYPSA